LREGTRHRWGPLLEGEPPKSVEKKNSRSRPKNNQIAKRQRKKKKSGREPLVADAATNRKKKKTRAKKIHFFKVWGKRFGSGEKEKTKLGQGKRAQKRNLKGGGRPANPALKRKKIRVNRGDPKGTPKKSPEKKKTAKPQKEKGKNLWNPGHKVVFKRGPEKA